MTEHHDVVVVGTGFAGLAAAWRLDEAGFTDVVLLEQADEVGGTWRDNVYPGAACDIRSDLYSLSFAPNPGWRHRYGRQAEIRRYLVAVSYRRGIRERIRFGSALVEAAWDAGRGRWRIRTARGELTARVLISGAGPFAAPVLPRIEGLETFEGPVLHTARWDPAVPLAGARIGVIGTGASAVQLVPAVAPIAARTTVFQRSAPWIVPRHDAPTSAVRRRLFAAVPPAQRIARIGVFTLNEFRHLGFRHPLAGRVFARVADGYREKAVADPALRARLAPTYRIGCKRILVSSDYYPALTRDDVDLVTAPIARIEPDGVRTADGRTIPLDVLVCATGFDAVHPPIATRIRGVDGVRLADAWREGMTALKGTTVAGFPNLFLLVGPNTALAHNSIVSIIESQVRYTVGALVHQRRTGGAPLDPRPEAQRRWTGRVQRSLARSVWVRGGCTSYYLDERGRNTTLWPGLAMGFRRALARFDPSEYRAA